MAVEVYPSETTVSGTVGSVNEKGIKLQPHNEWFNWSKFAVQPIAPEHGQTVTLTLDKQGFIRHCERTGGSAVQIAPAAPSSSPGTRDRVITRLAVLKAAAQFGASRPDLKSADVLRIADSWLGWIDLDADDDLDEAF